MGSGNVGIGFTSPDRNFQVAADLSPSVTVGTILGANGSQFDITGSTGSNLTKKLAFGLDTTNNYGYIQTGNNQGVGSTPPLALILQPAGGNVGIGFTSPNSPLYIQANSNRNGPLATIQSVGQFGGGGGFDKGLLIDLSNAATSFSTALHVKANSTELFSVNTDGNIGIGNSVPSQKLEINSDTSNPFVVTSGGNVGIGFTSPRASGITGTVVDISGGSNRGILTLGPNVTTQSASNPVGSLLFLNGSNRTAQIDATTGNSNLNGRLLFYTNNASGVQERMRIDEAGNVGIGFTSPAANLDIENCAATCLLVGNGTGKIDVGTVDPPYQINGTKYATYDPAMTGVKEETTGNVKLAKDSIDPTTPFKYVIDFSNLEEGSDLWLFKNVSDWGQGMNNLIVLLSANNQSAKVWYEKDPVKNTLTILGNCNCEVSYRLTAPRFNWAQYPNKPNVQDGSGFHPNNANDQYVGSGSSSNQITFTQDPLSTFLSNVSMDNDGNLVLPKIKVGSLTVDTSLATTSLSSANGQLAINSDPSYTSITPQTDSSSDTYYDLTGKIASLEERIATLESQVAGISSTTQEATPSASTAEATGSASLTANSTATPSATLATNTKLDLTSPDMLLASDSAKLTSLDVTDDVNIGGKLTAYQTNVQDSLKVFGEAYLGNTTVAGDLTVDGTLSVENGSEINVMGTLYLQKSALAEKLDIFNGKVTVDASGNIKTVGEVAAAAVTTNKLTISNTSVATPSASVSPTIGTATIPAGQTSITISSDQLDSDSKVFVTPNKPVLISVSTKNVTAKTFTVELATPQSADITFDWWIVETK